MSVERDASGRRRVQAEIEVPGTPEEVWRAIATGAGIASWFVPAEVDGRVGGEIQLSFGPGMDSLSRITAWEPPHRMVAESRDLGPGAPPVATEWIVEARAGGTCLVRVVHSLFADSDDWDGELGAFEGGWADYFRILRLYLTHFSGQPSALLALSATTSLLPADAWARLCRSLGVEGLAEGGECRVNIAGATPVRAHVERIGRAPNPEELLLRVGDPTPGLAHWFALRMGDRTHVSLRFYLYGVAAKATAARAEPEWQAGLERLLVE